MPGFVGSDAVRDALERASCLLAPSSREGFGLIVVEAAAAATPSVVVRGPDNAMVERIAPGINGFLVDAPELDALARAVVSVCEAGQPLRDSTAAWFAEQAVQLNRAAVAAAVSRRYQR